MKNKIILTSLVALVLTGCQNSGEEYAADVYDTSLVNSKQETKTVNIISILPAKVAVDNTENKKTAQTIGTIFGGVVGAITGHNVGTGSTFSTVAGTAGGATVGAAAGSLVKDKNIVEGVSLTYKEGTKLYTSTQVGRSCLFKPGIAVIITTKTNETRIQPNSVCPEK